MDVGLDRFLEMFEARFGRLASTILMGLIGLGVASYMASLIWHHLVLPLYRLARSIISDQLWQKIQGIPLDVIASLFLTMIEFLISVALIGVLIILFNAFVFYPLDRYSKRLRAAKKSLSGAEIDGGS